MPITFVKRLIIPNDKTHPPYKIKSKNRGSFNHHLFAFIAGLSLYVMLTQSGEIDENFALHDLFSTVINSLVVFVPILYMWRWSSSVPSLHPMTMKSVNPKAMVSIAALATGNSYRINAIRGAGKPFIRFLTRRI